ncbi:PP2C family protein-serine/threonine phosphatase [Actinomadura madurae]|uniref:Serine phosphatase RsbU, regulator of sigma subunit n=1 Tax=Actinomadura madurae TaxID=1993 RepID=A0A1I5CUV4_9ACTN|nr:GAF domain-containing SpoIIE family protein phosphatase [Actinomadura madurae]SFN90770.1 Serine phosphatase RsbU, regulator of sigma subunit [Actinomadura madurae]SPT50570.1 fused phosphoenolpyruvate-protein phosphotransferase PtsP/GAF domain [Actinomadura madurae]
MVDNASSAMEGAAARKLENIQAILGETFTHVDVDQFLDTLLERVKDVLEVDTATVLLLDKPGRDLVATAARGLEEEVVQAAHVPMGRGFAGRVAEERRPIYIADVSTADVFNPLLVQKGLHSLLGVPLIRSGTLVGVMHVGTLAPRRFTAEEEELLQIAASQAAMAVQSMLSQAERAGAQELQRSLIPSELPDVPGFELAARYRPGKAIVGGDWYDVFPLPTGEIGIVMGDVAGHGLPAAVVMGRMRSALRAYALESDDPAEVLHRLNRKMLHFEPEATATVLYALCDPVTGRVRVSSAGHPPPIFAAPGSPARAVDVAFDVLIGLDEVAPRRTATVDLDPGSLLGFYTDGLIERRDNSILTGIEKLCGAAYAGPPEQVAAAVMSELIGREPASDDVALLLVRRSVA